MPEMSAPIGANWSGSALFVSKYVNFYQKPGSSNLIGWELEVGGILIYSAWEGLVPNWFERVPNYFQIRVKI